MGIFDDLKGAFGGRSSPNGVGLLKTQIQSAEQQSDEEKELASYVKNKVEEIRATSNRIAHEGVWMTNVAYVLGYSALTWNTSLQQYQPTDQSRRYLSRNRIHSNL